MGGVCSTNEEEEFDVEFGKSAHESKGFGNDRRVKANPYANGGANLGRSSILQTGNAPTNGN